MYRRNSLDCDQNCASQVLHIDHILLTVVELGEQSRMLLFGLGKD